MELEILNEISSQLVAIKWILLIAGILILVLFIGIAIFLKTILELRNDGPLSGRLFKAEAADLSDAGDYETLKELSEERISKYKDDRWAHFYLGISNLRLENYAVAKAHLNKVREIDPSWDESVIGYLEEIDEKITLKSVK